MYGAVCMDGACMVEHSVSIMHLLINNNQIM